MPVPALSPTELALWCKFIYDISGIHLDDSKGYLIETRLGSLFEESCAWGWEDFLTKVKSDINANFKAKIIDAITTHETSFFRDIAPFELLQQKLIPEIMDRGKKLGLNPIPIRILSAACSTGQEVYSILMALKEMLTSFNGYDIRVVGLDISDAAIAKANEALFSTLEVERGIDEKKLEYYFVKEGDNYKIKEELRTLATFRKASLLDPIIAPTPFDIIFCRNIAIYFNLQDKIRLFKNMSKILNQNGALIVGSTETLTTIFPELEQKRHLRSVFYQMKTH